MEPRSLKYIAANCGGELLSGAPDTLVQSLSTDSRTAQSGDLFFALSGDTFDGHAFLDQVAGKGAAALVVARDQVPKNALSGVIAVDSPRRALGRLAGQYRKDFGLPLVAVAGSNGKTSAKELIASVLRQKFNTVCSEASFNNDIGVPVTLLRLDSNTQAAVLEIGTNHPGELAPLIGLIQPQYGVITSIGREHLEFFGDLNGVIAEEGTLAELLPQNGTLFLNGDGAGVSEISRRAKAQVIKVGFAQSNDWRVTALTMNSTGSTFTIQTPGNAFSGEYSIRLLGRHQVLNALFAIAIGAKLGLTRPQILRGLAEAKPAKMRLESWTWNGVCVLDDAYNANADSMLAALETLKQIECAGRRVAVLGDMAELGEHSVAAHEEIGRAAAGSGLAALFVIGKQAHVTAAAATRAGLQAVREFSDLAEVESELKNFLRPGDVVLFKASRSMRLERLTEKLKPFDLRKN